MMNFSSEFHKNRKKEFFTERGLHRFLISALYCLPFLFFLSHTRLFGNSKPEMKHQSEKIKAVVDQFRNTLSIPQDVFISIVSENSLLVSVERSKEHHAAFEISFDERFLDTLDDNELNAAVAHELGHVWIFTHHPYLHTELLANQIALKVVSKESLERIYAKLWKDKGTKGNIEVLPGE